MNSGAMFVLVTVRLNVSVSISKPSETVTLMS